MQHRKSSIHLCGYVQPGGRPVFSFRCHRASRPNYPQSFQQMLDRPNPFFPNRVLHLYYPLNKSFLSTLEKYNALKPRRFAQVIAVFCGVHKTATTVQKTPSFHRGSKSTSTIKNANIHLQKARSLKGHHTQLKIHVPKNVSHPSPKNTKVLSTTRGLSKRFTDS